ncbi:glutathione S-transferase family protein [Acinetobacter rudis]|uniref:Glutathione S-transferase n=1 Tax=Acinetobacter rudis CIP 110305 TaxID=421052 RepID=S3N4G4_9GAMM|nr:glutathione S-transferase [Acinetobacter rudis]EPF73333.1 glutathione S-transferase [Acinetobacter rudis CIP 110305]
MKLYDLELSGNCYKVRLFAALANIDLELIAVDFLAGEHKSTELLKLNPFGELPILDDHGFILRDSQAILIYLANKYAGEAWWPSSPQQQAEVSQWLFVTANEIQHGPCAARLIDLFQYPLDKQVALIKAERILTILNTHLSEHTWLAINRPTIADIAVYPYVALAHEGSIDLSPYVHIQAWLKRIQALPNYVSMPGL